MKCPCCEQDLPLIPKVKLVSQYCIVLHRDSAVTLTRQQFKIVEAVQRHKTTFAQLVDAAYADDPSGGPDTAQWCISGAITQANKHLKNIGLRIKGDRGSSHVALYGLIEI